MTVRSISGGYIPVGPRLLGSASGGISQISCSASPQAACFIGRVQTSDGASHTIDTTGSSSLGWRSDTTVFASGSTSVSVGLASVDTSAGPAPRPVNVSGTVTLDVKATFAGGGGGITQGWQTHVPTSGSKTLAPGDLVAFVVQMTARGGSDIVLVDALTAYVAQVLGRPAVTKITSGSLFAAQSVIPNCIITFSDGTLGWIEGGDVLSTQQARTWNNSSATKEYGQLYQFPFPVSVYGLYWMSGNASDLDVILYSDPLGTPVSQRDVFVDANTMGTSAAVWFQELFTSPYTVSANTPIGAVLKPATTSNLTSYYKTLASATHRVADPWGTTGYGISRASGAFANANSSLDHYYIGLLVGGFDDGVATVYPNSGLQGIEGGMSR